MSDVSILPASGIQHLTSSCKTMILLYLNRFEKQKKPDAAKHRAKEEERINNR
jgi:hypothetical protein